jgi:hypothetical protein
MVHGRRLKMRQHRGAAILLYPPSCPARHTPQRTPYIRSGMGRYLHPYMVGEAWFVLCMRRALDSPEVVGLTGTLPQSRRRQVLQYEQRLLSHADRLPIRRG